MCAKMKIYILIVPLALLLVGIQAQDSDDSTVVVADHQQNNDSPSLAPGQPDQGYSKDEIDTLIKLYLDEQKRNKEKESLVDNLFVQPENPTEEGILKQNQWEQVQSPEEFYAAAAGSPIKQGVNSDGAQEVAEVLGAGLLGGLLGAELGGGHQHNHNQYYQQQQGAYPYPGAGYPGAAGGYPSYPSISGNGYSPYPSVYPSYPSSPYYQGYGPAYQQNRPYGPQYPQADKFYSSPYEDYYNPYESHQGYPSNRPSSSPSQKIGGNGGLMLLNGPPKRPFNVQLSRKQLNSIVGGRPEYYYQGGRPLVGYLAKPESQYALASALAKSGIPSGLVDEQQLLEQAAIKDGPFVYIYPEQGDN